MNLYIVLILATTLTEIKAKPQIRSKDALAQDEQHKTAAQLAKQIHLVSYANVESRLAEKLEDGRAGASSDLQRMGPNQANLSPGLRPNQAYQGPGVRPYQAYQRPGVRPQQEGPGGSPKQSKQNTETRLHLIRNPWVLEEYQKRLLKPVKIHQLSEENGEKSTNSENSMLDQRRNAVFRLDTESIEKVLKSTSNVDLKTKHIPKLPKEVKERNQDIVFNDNSHDVDIFVDDDKRKKGRQDKRLTPDNAWDVITKKYNWNKKHSNQYEDGPRNKKEPQKEIKPAKFDDNWNNKVTKQDFDDWNKKKQKQNTFDDWPKRKQDNNMKWESAERKPRIKKDFDNSYEKPRKDRKNTDWDETAFKLSIPKTTKKWKQEKIDYWDKAHAPKISSYHNTRNKKSRDSFDSGGFFGRTPIPYIGRQGIYVDN